MTPANEFASPVSAVSTFSSIVHAAGKKVSWTPTRSVLLKAMSDVEKSSRFSGGDRHTGRILID
jgi:hypothetical protein